MDNELLQQIQNIILENKMLKTELSKLTDRITNIEKCLKPIQHLISEQENKKEDLCHPKNNPPLCMNRQKDYWEWIKECEEYDRLYG